MFVLVTVAGLVFFIDLSNIVVRFLKNFSLVIPQITRKRTYRHHHAKRTWRKAATEVVAGNIAGTPRRHAEPAGFAASAPAAGAPEEAVVAAEEAAAPAETAGAAEKL